MKYKVGDKILKLRSNAVREITKIETNGLGYDVYFLDGYDTCIYEKDIDHEATAKLKLPQPSKDMLRSGMKVIYRNKWERFVLLELNLTFTKRGEIALSLDRFKKDLTHEDREALDIMQIWNGDTLIAQRTEKSEAELKKESLEKQINECSDKIKNLHVCIENLELEIKSL